MAINLKSVLKRGLLYMGYRIHRVSDELGQDPFRDMQKLVASPYRPVIFDVGANVGQSIDLFRGRFEEPVIHAFEPGADTFLELRKHAAGTPDLYLNNFALGSRPGVSDFLENTCSVMSSFLEPGQDCWGNIRSRRAVEVKTIDDYCQHNDISHIEILKSDTQGFDLEVIRGAENRLAQSFIHLIFLEITFSDMYKRLPRLDEIYAFLIDRGFFLVSFYKFEYQNNRAGWTDALFINPKYRPPLENRTSDQKLSALV
jgi:FkbM family methyltransferase